MEITDVKNLWGRKIDGIQHCDSTIGLQVPGMHACGGIKALESTLEWHRLEPPCEEKNREGIGILVGAKWLNLLSSVGVQLLT